MRATDLLLVVDVQNDFLPGGALAVPDGDAVVAPIVEIAARFENLALTQDWHPRGHMSFASQHPGHKPFDVLTLPNGRDQVLWPDHCVQGTPGAAFSLALDLTRAQLIIRKGFHPGVDSYSAFVEADRHTRTGLAGYLTERGINRVFIAGLATDFCVAWSAVDAVAAGFETIVIEDLCRAIDTNGSLDQARRDMASAGVRMSRAQDVA